MKAQEVLFQSSSPEINWERTIVSPTGLPARRKKHLTGEMPHLRVLARPRLCQNLTRRNALQVLGYVPAEHILTARGRYSC